MKHDIGLDGKPIGTYNQNPILDSRMYEVEVPDGLMDEYYHMILLEKLLSQVDKGGREFMPMKEIADHNIEKYAIREWKKGIITTKLWNLLVEWKHGT